MDVWCLTPLEITLPSNLIPVYRKPKSENYFIWDIDGLKYYHSGNELHFNLLTKQLKYRMRFLSKKNELILQALKPPKDVQILDLSGGAGVDSFILANYGLNILMLERHWIIYLLLEDALRRAKQAKNLALNLQFGEGKEFLTTTKKSYPRIYFDPMFPISTKTAANQIKMQFLRSIIGDDSDASEVALIAKQKTHRLVIKRPRLAKPLIPHPTLVYRGNSSRFDVYLK